MKKQYTAIDIFKFIFAICVVGIHAGIMQDADSSVQWIIFNMLFRLAVPFFFVCSGFFLGLKLYQNNITIEEGKTFIIKYIKRLSVPFLFWLIISLPIQFYKYRNTNALVTIIKRAIFNPWEALWYLLAVIVAVLIILQFYKKNKLGLVVITGGVLYIFGLLCNSYYFLVENTVLQKIVDLYLKVFLTPRNGIFVGLYFVSIGMFIAKNIDTNIIKSKLNSVVLVISYVILFIEIFLIKNCNFKDDHSLYIMLTIVAPELLILLIRFKSTINTKLIRDYSTGIYFIHKILISTMMIFFEIYSVTLNEYIVFLITLISCISILTVLYKIDNKNINKVIK